MGRSRGGARRERWWSGPGGAAPPREPDPARCVRVQRLVRARGRPLSPLAGLVAGPPPGRLGRRRVDHRGEHVDPPEARVHLDARRRWP